MVDMGQLAAWGLEEQSFPGTHADDPAGAMLRLWRCVQPFRTAESLETEMNSLRPQLYERRVFEVPRPTLSAVQEELSREADEKVRPRAFWKTWQMRDEYVRNRVKERYAEFIAAWERERDAFDAREARIAEERDAAAEEKCERRRERIRKVLAGDASAVRDGVEGLSSRCPIPLPFILRCAYYEDKARMVAEIELPAPDELPQTVVEVTKSGRSRVRPKTQRALREEYARYLFAFFAYLAHGMFDLSPAIVCVAVSGYRTNEDAVRECVLSVLFDRKGFAAAFDDIMDPEAFCLSFEHRCRMTKTKVIKVVEPLERL